jgi:hypothetical protein
MAAPQVSGAAALLWSATPSLTATQVMDQLIATARDISSLPGIDDIYGPRLDVAQAFGMLSRPVVVGLAVDTPWVPRAGSAQERTVHVTTQIRGDSVISVTLEATANAVTQQQPMVDQGGGIYAADYTVPENSAYQRDIFLQVVAENGAGTMYGDQETVVQEGDPVPPPTIQILNGPPSVGRPVQFLVSWNGTWNNYDFYCGDYSNPIIYIPRGQVASCTYSWSMVYYAHAVLYQQDTWKTFMDLPVEVGPPAPVYLPMVVR